MQESGLLTPNKHAALDAIQTVRACMVDLISTVHGLPIRIVADEPPQSRQALRCNLHVHDATDHTAQIISTLDDAMKVDRVLRCIASDPPGIGIPPVFTHFLQADAIVAPQCQARSPTPLALDSP